ncbi:MAG: hypothetical protein WCL14_12530 [Bacteroidota bacterium]
MTKTLKFLLISLLFSASMANAQVKITSFSKDPTLFINEMQLFFEETNKLEAASIMNEFKAIWKPTKMTPKEEEKFYKLANETLLARMKDGDSLSFEYTPNSSRLTDKQIEIVIKNCNTMLKKRMKAFPDFRNYVYALISFVQSHQDDASFNGWQTSLDKLLQGANRYFATYINICNGLFFRNTLYSSASTRWVSSNNKYTFDFDSIPKIIFGSIDLKDFAKGDSSIIYHTQGVYYPTNETFYGHGGTVNWKRAGISPDTVYAELRDYTIKVNGDQYSADSVTFYDKVYFQKPLIGHFMDKIQAAITPLNATYPRFESYNKRIEIKQILKDIDYVGGFSINGPKMLGAGSSGQAANIIVYYKNKPTLVARSQNFTIRPEKITSSNAAVSLYYEKDSIYHPGLEFKFITKDRELALIRNDEGASKAPYYDSYHKLDMYFDAFYWKIDDPLIQIKMISASGQSSASFESNNFYRDYRFRNVQGVSETHPFYTLKHFSEKMNSKEFLAVDLAHYMHFSLDNLKPFLYSLAVQGYLTYDGGSDVVVLKDRMFYYINAREGKSDYDVLQFESTILGKPNAKLSLLDFSLDLNGVKRVYLSDSQNVYIYPKDQELKVLKNRDFKFAGLVKAGRFDFYGKEFTFVYDDFKIELKNVDSLRLKVPGDKPDANGKIPDVQVKSVLQNITGDLMIDNPANKSGVKDFPEYPIFNSKKDSYVFYDRSEVQKGVYHRDNFYFHLIPFTIDSLDNFSKEGLKFLGTFVSANIFPDFKDTLKLQPDFSLGFVRATPVGGFPVYGAKATYHNEIKLSHEGLRGDGELDYLTSIAKSKDFIFFPDSTNTTAFEWIVKKELYHGVEFPEVRATNIYIHYMPYLDAEYVYARGTAIDMYEGFSKFMGNYINTPNGLTGSGLMAFSHAELESELFHFKQNSVHCDTSDFRIHSDDSTTYAYDSKNVQADVDFIKKFGEFKSNSGTQAQKFPLNQYICYIDKFKWFMDKQTMEFSSSGKTTVNDTTNLELAGSEFVSTNPNQDSLRFRAPTAEYSLKDYVIHAHDVVNIKVADAAITPDSGSVTVRRKAAMDPFKNAKIVANVVTKYHNIYKADLAITSRKFYSGSGDYDYVDVTKSKQTIHLDKIAVDTTGQTYGSGSITDTSFTLGPPFQYKGDCKLAASNENLYFNGYGKLKFLNCEPITPTWFKFKGNINPTTIAIPVEKDMIDEEGHKLTSGIIHTKDSTVVYPAFLSPKERGNDHEVVTASGFLVYDKESKEYRISNLEKLQNVGLPGNYLSLSTKTCILYGEGSIRLGAELGQVEMKTTGTVSYNLNNKALNMDLLLLVDFFFNEDCMKQIFEQISATPSLSPSTDSRKGFDQGLSEMIGKDKAGKLISDMALYGSYKKFPPELNKSMFFTEVNMTYRPEYRAFRSVGYNSLGNIYKNQINKQMKSTVEVVKKRSGDILNIYFEIDQANWYFFSYQRGIMQAISSNEPFNKIIREMKPDKRILKPTAENKAPYQFMLSTERAKNNFLKKAGDDSEDDSKEQKDQKEQKDSDK